VGLSRECEQRTRDAPHDVIGRVLGARRQQGVQVVCERRVAREPGRHEQRPGLAEEQRGRVVVRLAGLDVGLGADELERAQRRSGEVERGLGVTAAPQGVERPDDSGRADVQALQRRRSVARVPLVRGPERLSVERGAGVRHDPGNRLLYAGRIPRLAAQRLELGRVVEHGASLRDAYRLQP
jgi:hypothetical protein